jgi:hypothetical protein
MTIKKPPPMLFANRRNSIRRWRFLTAWSEIPASFTSLSSFAAPQTRPRNAKLARGTIAGELNWHDVQFYWPRENVRPS